MTDNLPGEAYLNGVSKAPLDLMMSIAEYAAVSPSIGLSTTFVDYSVQQGSAASTQTFTVRNAASGTLSYQLSENSDWLDISPTQGTSAGEEDTITMTFTPTGLARGTYNGTITVTDPQASNSPQFVVVSFKVKGYPGDMDGDLDVDLEDWGLFQLCLTAAGTPQTDPSCEAAHLDEDPDVDSLDVDRFLSCLGGPELPVPVGCE
jgi:hypothetical protein